MPPTQRRVEPGVGDKLLRQPHSFEFFQAVRILLLLLRQVGIEHEQALSTILRFDNRLSLAFPASQIAALAATADHVESAEELLQAFRNGNAAQIRMTPAFMGLLGINGGLPVCYTEQIADFEHLTKDGSARAFMDILSTRSVSLFFGAWAKYRSECMVDGDAGDAFMAMLHAIGGTAPSDDASTPSGGVVRRDELLAFYASRFRGRSMPASVIAGVLTEYFEVPVTLQALVGVWEDLPERHQTRLGVSNNTLGDGAMLGGRIFRHDARAILRIGPVNTQNFERFLPRTEGASAMNKVLGMFCGAGMTFEVCLVLHEEDVRPARLSGSKSGGGPRLGFDAFLLGGGVQKERSVRYHLRP